MHSSDEAYDEGPSIQPISDDEDAAGEEAREEEEGGEGESIQRWVRGYGFVHLLPWRARVNTTLLIPFLIHPPFSHLNIYYQYPYTQS
jgi:hypothetical protein